MALWRLCHSLNRGFKDLGMPRACWKLFGITMHVDGILCILWVIGMFTWQWKNFENINIHHFSFPSFLRRILFLFYTTQSFYHTGGISKMGRRAWWKKQMTKHNPYINMDLELLDEKNGRSRRLEEDSGEMWAEGLLGVI